MSPFDDKCIRLAIDYSEVSFGLDGYTPFGAVVGLSGQMIGQAASAVMLKTDPSAHAEVLAIREACENQGSHLLPGATLYCSAFPCPLCFMAARWAGITRIVYAATLEDSASVGFEDSQFYTDLSTVWPMSPYRMIPASVEMIFAGEVFRSHAAGVLRKWKADWDRQNTEK